MTDRSALRKQILAQRAALPEAYRQHKSAEICTQLLHSLDLSRALVPDTPAKQGRFIVGVYSAFPDEVSLHDFILGAYQRGCEVAFPCMVSDAHGMPDTCEQKMEMRLVSAEQYAATSVEQGKPLPPSAAHKTAGLEGHDAAEPVYFLLKPLKKYMHDAPEIAYNPYVSADELSMLVCPLVGFDKNGNRLGYGGGNYDRYLAQYATPEYLEQLKDTCLEERSRISPEACRVVGVAFTEQEIPAAPVDDHDIPIVIVSR